MATVAQVVWPCDGHMSGGWWWVMGIGWLLVVAIIAALAFVLIRSVAAGQRSATGAGGPLDTLTERFARGEIDEDEYRQRREVLRS
jgi:putative membrane protein